MTASAHPAPSTPALRPPGRVAAAIGLGQLVVWGSSFYLLAVLAAPIAQDTGWAPGWVAAGLSIGLAVAGLVSRRVGRLIDARGGRGLLALSALLTAAGLVVMALAPSLPAYLAAWAVVGLGMGCGLYDPAFATLGRLYGTRARTAITQVTLVAGFSSTICWPVSAALADALGWRGACLAWAVVDLALVAPLYLLAVPRAPDPVAITEPPHHRGPAGAADARLDRSYLALAAIVTGGAAIMTLVATELLVILRAGGLAAPVAVAVGALFGPSQVAARLGELLTRGRYHPAASMLVACLLVATGLAILLVVVLSPGDAAALVVVAAAGVIAYGAGTGLRTIARGTLPLALYGARGYPVVIGRLAAPALVGQAVAPVLGALLVERFGAGPTSAILAAGATLIVLPAAFLVRTARVRPR